MRKLLRQREIVTDDWVHLPEGEPAVGASVIVPVAELRENAARWANWQGKLGVRIVPATHLDEILPELSRLQLVAIEFPAPGEGRGYTQARLLRERHGFKGEIRAVGAVKRDQVFFMSRCGFDAFEVSVGEDIEAVQEALGRYSVTYQPERALSLR